MRHSPSLRSLALAALLFAALPAHAAGFFWRAEATTLTADDNSADTSATLTGSASISNTAEKVGTNGILTVDANDFYTFTVTADDLCDEAQGEIAGWVQFKSAVPTNGNDLIVRCMNSGNSSEVSLSMGSAGEIRLQLVTSAGTATNFVSTGCGMSSTDVWYYVVGKWHIANDDRSLACYTDAGGGALTQVDLTTDLTTDLAALAPGAFDQVRVGSIGGHTSPLWVDNVHVSTTYGTGLENFAFITSFVPTYTGAPADGTFTATTLPFTYTPDQKGTTYAAACTNGQTIATFANLKSGTCSGGAALGTGSDASSAGVSDTVTITGLSGGTTHDVYVGHESDIGGQSSITALADRATTSSVEYSTVQTFADEDRSPRTGFVIASPSSLSATSIFDCADCIDGGPADDYFDPDFAANDVIEYEDDTNEDEDCNVSFEADGDFVLAPVGAGDCDTKRSFNILYQDYSGTGFFTAPDTDNPLTEEVETDDIVCNLNNTPEALVEDGDIVLLTQGAVMTEIDLSTSFSDADGDPLVIGASSGTVPSGTDIDEQGLWTGTPDTEDEDGEELTILGTEECGGADGFTLVVFVTDDEIDTPDCVSGTVAACLILLDPLRPWLAPEDQLTATFGFSPTVAAGDIISQNPASAATMTANDPLAVVVSLGVAPVSTGRRGRYLRLELGIH